MDALPDFAIQLDLIRCVRLGQVSRRDPGPEGTGVTLVEGPRVWQVNKRGRVRSSREAIPQRRSPSIVLAERRKAEDLLDRTQD